MNDIFNSWSQQMNQMFQNASQGYGQGFKMPQMPQYDASSGFSSMRKNAEAASAAFQAFTEGFQQVARRNVEFVRENVESGLNAARDLMTTTTPDTNAAKQAEYAKDFAKKGMSQFREVTEMMSKAQFDAFDIINKRLTASMNEAKKMSDKKAA